MKTPVVIIGGGPGGAATSMFLARQGIESVIVEKETFPRFHIGESLTGEASGVLRSLNLEPELKACHARTKHGVNVYGGSREVRWFVPVMKRNAQRQLEPETAFQFRRSSFDKLILDKALATGGKLISGRATAPIMGDDGAVRGVRVKMADGGEQTIESELVVDCSGQSTFLANRGITGKKFRGSYDKQIAIFTHMAGIRRDNDEPHGDRTRQPGNTLIFYQKKYHWSWVIPLDEEISSVGIVVPSKYFTDRRESKLDFIARELRELNPELAERSRDARFVEEGHAIPNYSFQVDRWGGRGYICIGDAHRFIDPIFSFGLYVSLKEAQLLADPIKAYLNGHKREQENPFADFTLYADKGADIFEDVIDAFWENPLAFAFIVHSRHTADITDVFAGRVFGVEPSPGVMACRQLLKRTREYGDAGSLSLAGGSRFDSSRAALWNTTAPEGLVSTEAWMRDDD